MPDERDDQLGYDADHDDPRQYCRHGTFIGSWWGPDYLCHWCELGEEPPAPIDTPEGLRTAIYARDAEHLLDHDRLAELLGVEGGDVLVALCGLLTAHEATTDEQVACARFVVQYAMGVLEFNATEGEVWT